MNTSFDGLSLKKTSYRPFVFDEASCKLCPIECGADRAKGVGACGVSTPKIAKYYLHPFEEPCISFRNGSGTVFFTGCNLRCVFCQNYELSRAERGKAVTPTELADTFKELEDVGAENISLVTAGHFIPYLLPAFESKYGYTVEVASAGTGKAIQAAKDGNADLILVHSKSQEVAFIDAGFGRVVEGFEAERISFIYNYFVLCGPSADPAGVKTAASVKDAFAAIAEGKYTFISRGDGSGTHTKELALWPADLGIAKEAETFADYTEWYVSANTGMGACLVMAEEMDAYILTDKATFLTFQANGGVMN